VAVTFVVVAAVESSLVQIIVGVEVELVMLACLDKYVQLMKHEQNRDSMLPLEKKRENLLFE
jgi:hypothetical protein